MSRRNYKSEKAYREAHTKERYRYNRQVTPTVSYLPWRPDEIAYLCRHQDDMTIREVAEHLGRSVKAVSRQRTKLRSKEILPRW